MTSKLTRAFANFERLLMRHTLRFSGDNFVVYQVENKHKPSKALDINSTCRICMGQKPLMTPVFCSFRSGCQISPDLATRISQVSNHQVCNPHFHIPMLFPCHSC